MALTIRIYERWTAQVDDGVWCVLEGPADIAVALNAIADAAPAGVHVDEQRLREARVIYPDLRVLPSSPATRYVIH